MGSLSLPFFRESAAINICKYLLEEHANIVIYDPKVSEKQIHYDLVSSDVYGGLGQDLEHGQIFLCCCFFSRAKMMPELFNNYL